MEDYMTRFRIALILATLMLASTGAGMTQT
jgi:hypothetical protein